MERGSIVRRSLETFRRRNGGVLFKDCSHRRIFSRVNDWREDGTGGSLEER